jgi:hypothetical protein
MKKRPKFTPDPQELLNKFEELKNAKLTITGHGYSKYNNPNLTIEEATQMALEDYKNEGVSNPALGLLSVVLAANRSYEIIVVPRLKQIKENKPDMNSFSDLSAWISEDDENFLDIYNDKKKLQTLKDLLLKIDDIKRDNPEIINDYDLMKKWAIGAIVQNYKEDVIGSITNIGIATFQHLRMVFGANTVKPDLRVKQVLEYEFNFPPKDDLEAILVVENIAHILNREVLYVDQIFVKYGSSYYYEESKMPTVKEIAKKLIKCGVQDDIILEATGLSALTLRKLKSNN